ncbi:hypothetical protein C1G86_0160 [Dehalococcoides mccartyi]|uniref:Uncharacterized protein n=2 Tax=Dehalococcoides mccartyi TaxID=61435 RepID=A0A142V830_9CHLR|nr:hypothetical protein Dm11a5_0086 [Dehalococcoides mccartyi]CAI82399.1 hypothetical protein cbdbB8 [Dehalococcoides mccartyi CBDB1]AOV98792.1 hypothetical protein DCWBC2_0117 [Dehalococcoides mccartyi]MBA2084549.1 hypothetical protein [Dehalococcoides mccartyi]RAL69830.1 hypothetical protein C1G87_0176 [Dehalococcoides mccartyi]
MRIQTKNKTPNLSAQGFTISHGHFPRNSMPADILAYGSTYSPGLPVSF